ncbi:23S ribosomal RNA methyltransferase Erm [Paenibacillus mesophilus]|uniref:23S ribosomal RNA methyltransferase Erm n=1 Tax=Paenibacillus mesophilus TaxID=2582849 RepID=UPI001EE43AE0|nr:23S ribosomal RNA methyltransferase Erm [Paenibacillus mesophilus]
MSNFSAQHLLIHKRLVEQMIALAKITPRDLVLDIGAGTGAITFPLAAKAAHVLAVENDPTYVRKLSSKLNDQTNIRIKQIDFLQLHLPKEPFCVVANIPYSITTPIFAKLLSQPAAVKLQRAVLLIEKGAAKRFTATPITDPRILGWRMWYEIRLVRTVSPNHFSPPPRVDSAVVTVSRISEPVIPQHHHERFLALAAYGLRDPMLPFGESMSGVFTPPQLARLVKTLKIDRHRPVCYLNERQWGELFLAMIQHVQPHRWPKRPKHRPKKSR